MLKYYPSHKNLRNSFARFCGQHYGITESQILTSAKGANVPNVALCTSKMPDYHKVLVHELAEMNHHLSGYGTFMEEAMVRLLGESIERYALLVASPLFREKVIYASYNEIKKQGLTMPWEYIKIYSDEDYEKLSKVTGIQNISQDDKIGWLKCPSIFDEDQEIFIPYQLLFTGNRINSQIQEVLFAPGFSKGSAAHTSFKMALKSAILEAVEADALMIRWYTKIKARKVLIDDITLISIITDFMEKLNFELIPYEYSLPDMPGHTFGLAMLNREDDRPVVILGCQTNLDPIKGLYRALLEALAIHYLATNGPLIVPEHYLLPPAKDKGYVNLDTNVAFWANAQDADFKRNFLQAMTEGELSLTSLKNLSVGDEDQELGYLLGSMKKVSDYGVYLDITPPEIADKGWKVIRTFFPELVQMSLPGFPYSNHPRLKKFGGIQNELPHPVP